MGQLLSPGDGAPGVSGAARSGLSYLQIYGIKTLRPKEKGRKIRTGKRPPPIVTTTGSGVSFCNKRAAVCYDSPLRAAGPAAAPDGSGVRPPETWGRATCLPKICPGGPIVVTLRLRNGNVARAGALNCKYATKKPRRQGCFNTPAARLCNMGHIALRNGLYRTPKRPILQREMTHIATRWASGGSAKARRTKPFNLKVLKAPTAATHDTKTRRRRQGQKRLREQNRIKKSGTPWTR